MTLSKDQKWVLVTLIGGAVGTVGSLIVYWILDRNRYRDGR